MSKPTFTNEFEQGVVDYVSKHPSESKVAIAKQFGVADHKWLNDAANTSYEANTDVGSCNTGFL